MRSIPCQSRRHYSETTTEPTKTQTDSEPALEESSKEEQTSPELEKLQAKEAEVLDLTVRKTKSLLVC